MAFGLLLLVFLVADWLSLFLLHDLLQGALDVGGFAAFGLVLLWVFTAGGLGVLTMTVGGYREVMKGWRTAARLQRPDKHFLDASLMVAAGALLLIPGVVSDVLAVLLIVPFTRWIFRPLVTRRALVQVNGRVVGGAPPRPRREPPRDEGDGAYDVDDYRVE